VISKKDMCVGISVHPSILSLSLHEIQTLYLFLFPGMCFMVKSNIARLDRILVSAMEASLIMS